MSENFDKWIEVLRTTDLPQVTGSLRAQRYEDGRGPTDIGYCCLGVACTLLPEGGALLDNASTLGITLAPYPAVEWLGLSNMVSDHRAETWENERAGFDFYLDLPDTYLDRPDDNMASDEGYPYEDITAAGMNDEGFTFSQIADMFAYFGVKAVA